MEAGRGEKIPRRALHTLIFHYFYISFFLIYNKFLYFCHYLNFIVMTNNTSSCSKTDNTVHSVRIDKNCGETPDRHFLVDFDSVFVGKLSFSVDSMLSYCFSIDGDASAKSILHYREVAEQLDDRIAADRSGLFEKPFLSVAFEFLDWTRDFLDCLLEEPFTFHPDTSGFLRLSKYLSLYSYVVFELNVINACFDMFSCISPSLQAAYVDSIPFKACLSCDSGGKVSNYRIKIRSLRDFKIKCTHFLDTL